MKKPLVLAPVKIAKTGNRYIITLPRRARYVTRQYRGKALKITIEEMPANYDELV